MVHWVRSKNLPYSVEEIKKMTSSCDICSEIKPRFYKSEGQLIKAVTPFERLALDFKGPLPTTSHNRYLLTVIDEYSRFPFAFPCRDISAASVIKHLSLLFSIFGMPSFIHSDRGSSFMSTELKQFLHSNGIATSHSTVYNPQGNGQVERANGTIWRTIELALRSKRLKVSQWELTLQEALHSIRSLLCTSTNSTPHERMFIHNRISKYGQSIPTWLTAPGTVLMKKHVRATKYEPLVEKVQLLEVNPYYSKVRLSDGREMTVSNRHLAPRGELGCSNLRDESNDDNDESNIPSTST